jgi:uncharacterized protein YfaS (alpha-2-macroglobulin family)
MKALLSSKPLLVATFVLGAGLWIGAQEPSQTDRRQRALTALQAGNFKDGYENFRKLALDPAVDPLKVGTDLIQAIQCLQRLGRQNEMDEFREAVIALHAKNWRLLVDAAKTYSQPNFEHFGYIVAGKFERGNHRGGGRFVQAFERDRVRALQLMDQALPLTKNDNDKVALANFHLLCANILLTGDQGANAWRLQFLSDLAKLPDYDETGAGPILFRVGKGPIGKGPIGGVRGRNHLGAPVDVDGKPIYHALPKSYETAQSDGERWRWNLMQVAEFEPDRQSEVDMIWGNFLRSQFGEQTMAQFGALDGDEPKTGTYALDSLGDNETIARLATGVRRFEMPDEFNYIRVFERVADRGRDSHGERALGALGSTFENRRQYPKAAAIWARAVKEYGAGPNNIRQEHVNQIVKNWGRFEPTSIQPSGKNAVVDFRFRNGSQVSFEMYRVDFRKLLVDTKEFIASYVPGQLRGPLYTQSNIGNIGTRLVNNNETRYLLGKVAAWDMNLTPRPNHVDERITITTPMQEAGAYLLTAKMADGNVSNVIVWITDTVLIKRQLEGQTYYFAADAVTGAPIADAAFDFFGWKEPTGLNPKAGIDTRSFSLTGDKDGQLLVPQAQQPQGFQWLIVARRNKNTPAHDMTGFAYLGFSNVWFTKVYDADYSQTRVFAMTDRPVYRPDQTVQYKFWVRHAQFDQADTSSFAGKTFHLEIQNPKGEKILDTKMVADEYGGFSGELALPPGATLGQYTMSVKNNVGVRPPTWQHAGNTFRVEEYKKPEFEVKVDAPAEPVKLGDKVPVTIDARYYFGGPVTQASVKYKVTRTPHSAEWYPRGQWDSFYGAGYWWFAPAYEWYPGWARWGCRGPAPMWARRAAPPPELVMENELPIGPDGKVVFEIDSAIAKEFHGDQDHAYAVTAEVVDASRRTIIGNGNVVVARTPFKVYSWLDRGYYRSGDIISANFSSQTLDKKPAPGHGVVTLYSIGYDAKNEPVEKVVSRWPVSTDGEGYARQQLKPNQPGQYRIVYRLTDLKNNISEGATVFLVRGDGYAAKDARFNDLELIPQNREYQPGDKVKLLINTNRENGAVLLFARPANGVYVAPKVVYFPGKSTVEEIDLVQRDMPNMFVEAVTVANGKVFNEVREIVVPPERRILNVAVVADHQEYKPGEKATVTVKLTEASGEPFVGSTVVTVYDKSVEYISGGSNVPDIKDHFWKWRRKHTPQMETNVSRIYPNQVKSLEKAMKNLGVFGVAAVEEVRANMLGKVPMAPELKKGFGAIGGFGKGGGKKKGGDGDDAAPMAAPAAAANGPLAKGKFAKDVTVGADPDDSAIPDPGAELLEPAVRKNFIDTAYWNGSLTTGKDGVATVSFRMPEQLTGWKLRVWGMGHGTKVGQGDAEVVTKKDLIVRLQAPRFFVQKDEVVLSANVHNYLKTEKRVRVSLNLDGGTLAALDTPSKDVVIAAGGEQRVDWRVRVVNSGEAIIRMKAQTDVDADAMEMRFPSYIHGMAKVESFAGVIRPEGDGGKILFSIPSERRAEQTRLELRYSPTLAGAMVDALPYLVDFPYGCTEQTLNRFVPTVITQKILRDMKIDLADVEKHLTNLNAQQIGNDKERIGQWNRFKRNPVFNTAEVEAMTQAGVGALAQMQISDGGWGWFSGWAERSWPHTTATVVHGLQLAKASGVQLPPGMLERGEDWLRNYQIEQVGRLHNFAVNASPAKQYAAPIDAFVYMVLADAGVQNDAMRDFLYRDRTQISVYGKAMFGLALHKNKDAEKLATILENIGQYVVEDADNQTAYLKLPTGNPWWNWHGSEIEGAAYYLKLLSRTNPRDAKAAGLVKYLLNNRQHAVYWTNTRDTAICVEAMAEYLKASGENHPEMTVEVWLDGKKAKEVSINERNLFTFDNKLVLTGDALAAGKHTLELKRKGSGPVYFSAYVTNFTLEDQLAKAGLEVRVDRKFYKLIPIVDTVKASGARGQALDQKTQKFQRLPLANLAAIKSGDLVEVELEIQSKNDYEYLIFEDMKPAGFEPVEVQSGYTKNDMGAYCEYRDEKVVFFVRALARGDHSLRYRMRAEVPGQFSALPTRAAAMYAPELRGNSDEITLKVGER